MKLNTLKPAEGSKKSSKRIGRGVASGHGKTSTKGHKGQKARSGGTKGPVFEGGQTPLARRVPKRGFSNFDFKKEFVILNIQDLAGIDGVDLITPEVLMERGMIKDLRSGLKILGTGEIGRAVTVKANAFSSSAAAKISAAGGKAEVM
ncbi:MAG: 50S ribosomal protein L15 [Nitrospirales bacterium]|nr:50S ribosomal protein L15 [Nitrospirales bacterium]